MRAAPVLVVEGRLVDELLSEKPTDVDPMVALEMTLVLEVERVWRTWGREAVARPEDVLPIADGRLTVRGDVAFQHAELGVGRRLAVLLASTPDGWEIAGVDVAAEPSATPVRRRKTGT